MENALEQVLRWAGEGENLALPTWEELPAIPLYMDQVIFYLKDSLELFQREPDQSLLTSSMINNYVKNGVIPHPEKKKYGREHLGALLAVSMLKQVLSIQDIGVLLSGEDLGPELYQLFREAHIGAVQDACRELKGQCQSPEDLKRTALRMAAEANARRAAAERILVELAKAEGGKKKQS